MTTSGLGYYADTPSIKFVPPNGSAISLEATALVETNGSSIISVTITEPGQGYQPIPSTVSIMSSAGSGAQLSPLVNAAGQVVAINVLSPGLGYSINDLITVSRAVIFNSNYTDATLQITTVSLAGEILAVKVINSGSGYQSSVTTVEIVSTLNPLLAYPLGTGFTATVLTDIYGAITQVLVNNSGAGYATYAPYLVISDLGSGAITRVTVDDQTRVSAVEVVSPGRNYTQNATGVIYNPPTALGMNPPEVAAIVDIEVSNNTFGTDPGLYYRVWAGLETNKAIQLQINAVVSYFKGLGYTVTIQSNPGNTNTIQWQIGW